MYRLELLFLYLIEHSVSRLPPTFPVDEVRFVASNPLKSSPTPLQANTISSSLGNGG
jgi:hypothetical protein